MRPHKQEVYLLVKALSKSETRWIRKYLKSNDKSEGSLKLFNLFKSLNSYNVEQIGTAFKPKLEGSRLAHAKSRLGKLILDGMRDFNARNSSDKELLNLLADSRLLTEKGLVRWSEKVLITAKSKVIEEEKYWALPPLLDTERALLQARQESGVQNSLQEILQETTFALETLQREYELKDIHAKLLQRIRTNLYEPRESKKKFLNEVLNHELIHVVKGKETFTIRKLVLVIKANANHFLGEYPQAIKNREELVEMWEKNATFRKLYKSQYIIALANLAQLYVRYRTDNFQQVRIIIKKIKAIDTRSYNERLEKFQNLAFTELSLHLREGSFSEILSEISFYEAGLAEFSDSLSRARKISIMDIISTVYFLIHDYRTSLLWLQKISDTEKLDPHSVRQDVKINAMIVKLLVFYELNDTDNVISLSRSIKYHLPKLGTHFPLEDAVRQCIVKLSNSKGSEAKMKILEDLDLKITKMRNDRSISAKYSYNIVAKWLSTKLKQSRSPNHN